MTNVKRTKPSSNNSPKQTSSGASKTTSNNSSGKSGSSSSNNKPTIGAQIPTNLATPLPGKNLDAFKLVLDNSDNGLQGAMGVSPKQEPVTPVKPNPNPQNPRQGPIVGPGFPNPNEPKPNPEPQDPRQGPVPGPIPPQPNPNNPNPNPVEPNPNNPNPNNPDPNNPNNPNPESPSDSELANKPWYRRLMDGALEGGRNALEGLARNFTDMFDAMQKIGNCGVVSSLNVINAMRDKMGKPPLSEDYLTNFAMRNGLCSSVGGTNAHGRLGILDAHGVDASHLEMGVNSLADKISKGHGVIASVNADTLGSGSTRALGGLDHAIMLSGVIRDKATGEVEGFLACNSGAGGGPNRAQFIPVDVLNAATGHDGIDVEVTDKPII